MTWVRFPPGSETYSSTFSDRLWGPPQSPIQWVRGGGGKMTEDSRPIRISGALTILPHSSLCCGA
jgi:hypothetical protein